MPKHLTRNTLDPARLPTALTPRQFVDLSGFSSATVYRWLESGYLRGTKAGPKLWRIPRSELARVAGWEGIPDT